MPASIATTPLEKFVLRAGTLYSLPAVAMEVLRLTSCPKVDTAALRECIERDPALVGKILRTVNSSLFGLSRNISDLNQAVTLLGIKPLKLLVLGFSLPPNLLSGLEKKSLERYWRTTLLKAAAARDLAGGSRDVDADDAFLAGLLQDIGMLVLLQDLGEPYALFLDRTRQERGDLLMLELDTLGFDHRLLSSRLLASWGLPETFWRAVADTHENPSTAGVAPNNDLTRVLQSADALAQVIAEDNVSAVAALSQQQSDSEPWIQLAGRLQETVDQLADLFDVTLPAGVDYQQTLLAAYARLSQEAELAAAHLAAADASTWQETRQLEAAASAFTTAAACAFDAYEDAQKQGRATGSFSTPSTAAAVKAQLASDPGSLGRVARAVTNCRRRRQPLSLLLIEVDEFNDLAFELGIDGTNGLLQRLQAVITAMIGNANSVWLWGDGQVAVLLTEYDRHAAVETARRLLDVARTGKLSPAAGKTTLSIGLASVALPAKNFPPEALIEAAERCLFGAGAGGGDAVKSIDIY